MTSLTPAQLRALADALDAPIQAVPEIKEYTGSEVAKLLHRSPGWVARHRVELGGYREGNGWWHFPGHGIRLYQQRQSAAQARSELRATG